VCNITSQGASVDQATYSPLTRLVIAAVLFRAKWPFFADVVLETKTGGLRSAWSSDVTRLPEADGCNMGDAPSCVTNGSIPTLWRMPVSLWSDYITSAARAQNPQSSFSLMLTGASNITLVADSSTSRNLRTGFTSGTRVFMNGQECNVSWLSPDGNLLRILTPSFNDLCPGGSCVSSALVIAPQTLSVSQVGEISSATGTTLVEKLMSGAVAFSTPISCPPFCPGDTSTIPFYVTEGGAAPGTGAVLVTSEYNTRVSARSLSVSSAGVQYSTSCANGGFIGPDTGICMNASHPLFSQCAYGAADACVLCPKGARCPADFAHGLYQGITPPTRPPALSRLVMHPLLSAVWDGALRWTRCSVARVIAKVV
jgi:hypothetical protein